MTREEKIELLEKEKAYMLSHGGDKQAIALDSAIKALEQEPCDDAISRQWLMECVNEGWIKFDTEEDKNRFTHLVRDMAPPVTAEPKIGKWIINGIGYSETYSYKLSCSCSVCGYKAVFYDHISSTEPCLENANYVHKFCPNCGFRMIESQESVGNTDRFRKRG